MTSVDTQLVLTAACQCGANHFVLSRPPLLRFFCHCSICQRYTGQAVADVTLFGGRALQQQQLQTTHFRRWKKPPNLERGSCLRCGQPVIEFALGRKLIFVPTGNIHESQQLPKASCHLFYASRQAEVTDGLPKCQGAINSQRQFGVGLIRGLWRSR